MFAFLSEFLQKKSILTGNPLPLGGCRIMRPYLLERAGIADGTVFLLAVPYFSHACTDSERNLSAYACAKDYHLFFKKLFGELLPILQERFPSARFAAFADHSPIAEVEAASRAGLGVIGENGLLLTPLYSSYIFLGEIVTDAILPDAIVGEMKHCEGCMSCRRACPAKDGITCLSALTQKKGTLTEEEQAYLLRSGSAWGCDICQEVCPHTRRALARGTIYSPISFFQTDTLPAINSDLINTMTDDTFAERAYSWRGRETIQRNLCLLEAHRKGDSECYN